MSCRRSKDKQKGVHPKTPLPNSLKMRRAPQNPSAEQLKNEAVQPNLHSSFLASPLWVTTMGRVEDIFTPQNLPPMTREQKPKRSLTKMGVAGGEEKRASPRRGPPQASPAAMTMRCGPCEPARRQPWFSLWPSPSPCRGGLGGGRASWPYARFEPKWLRKVAT